MGRIGRYEIVSEIGRGSMGVVYLAQDPHVRRRVAVKTFVLPEGLTEDQETEYTIRFLREAHAAGLLSHPGIVTIYDAGTDPEAGVPFIAMEYVEGKSLRELLAGARRLPAEQVFALAGTLAEALGAAHEAGIVHRDIKPANILVRSRDGAAKIVDFGVARLSTSDLTGAGDVFGSPAYMSPEQFRGGAVDGRSDLFSLAVILYQALCGERPFAGEDLSSLAYTVVHSTPPSLSSRIQGFPPALDRFFDRALAKDPADRFQDGHAFKRALAAAREGRSGERAPGAGLAGRVRRILGRAGTRGAAGGAIGGARTGGRRRFKPVEAAFAIVMLGLALLPGIWALWGGGTGREGIRRAGSEPAGDPGRKAADSPRPAPKSVRPAGGGVASDLQAENQVAPGAGTATGSPTGVLPVASRTATPEPEGRSDKREGRSGSGSVVPFTGASLRDDGGHSERTVDVRAPETPEPPPSQTRHRKAVKDEGAGARGSAGGKAVTGGPTAAEGSVLPGHGKDASKIGEGPAPQRLPGLPEAGPADNLAGRSLSAPKGTWLQLNARSWLKDGRMILFVDGREVFSRDLSLEKAEQAGSAQKRKWFTRKEEAFEAKIELAPGRHEIMVRVFPEGKDAVYEDKKVIDVQDAEPYELHLLAGRALGHPVKLKSD